MDLRYIRLLVDQLNAQGVVFDRGLDDDEVAAIEAAYGLRFPPDLRKLLQHALPISERFPNWRGRPAALRESLAWPAEGIRIEVERHHFWQPEWGERPVDSAEALRVANRQLGAAPPLVPVYAHRYMPCQPALAGNPVFSVVGTDVIYAGCDLASYFATEFGVPCPAWAAQMPRPIAFWDALVS